MLIALCIVVPSLLYVACGGYFATQWHAQVVARCPKAHHTDCCHGFLAVCMGFIPPATAGYLLAGRDERRMMRAERQRQEELAATIHRIDMQRLLEEEAGIALMPAES